MATKKEGSNCKGTREAVRDKRDAAREKARDKRTAIRGAAGALLLCFSLACLAGCATATPSSKSQSSKACNNVITVNLNLTLATNAVACAQAPGSVNITLSDLLGTQVQSADAGGNETVDQTAAPANTSGIQGDKPIDAIADTTATIATGGGSAAVKKAASALGVTPSTTKTAEATATTAANCTGLNCSDAAPK